MDSKQRAEELKKEKARIEEELKKTPEVTDMGSDTEGEMFEEEADEAEEFSKNIGVKNALKERLAEINSELAKLEKGK